MWDGDGMPGLGSSSEGRSKHQNRSGLGLLDENSDSILQHQLQHGARFMSDDNTDTITGSGVNQLMGNNFA